MTDVLILHRSDTEGTSVFGPSHKAIRILLRALPTRLPFVSINIMLHAESVICQPSKTSSLFLQTLSYRRPSEVRRCFRIRIRRLVLQCFDYLENDNRKDRAAQRPKPVHPMLRMKVAQHDSRGEGAGWVERSAGPEDTWIDKVKQAH